MNFFCISDYESAARKSVPHMAWEYLCGGAGDELTLDWNRAAFDRLKILPNVLRDVSSLDTRVNIFGRELSHPVLLAPVAYNKLYHPDGEIATARGAQLAGATYVMSTMSNFTIEEIVASVVPHSSARSGLWYQLYVQRNRDYTQRLIERVIAAGSEAIVITVDTPVLGSRLREQRVNFALPEGLDRAMLRDVPEAMGVTGHQTDSGIYYPLVNPAMTWDDIRWMISVSTVPIVLKGILHPDDAARAVDVGAQGMIVSNHGARNLDTVPATIELLPQIAARVQGKIPILLDGGIRKGVDILKALALGANAVLIGRPYIWGLSCGGAEGVARVVELLVTELKLAMALTGRASITEIDRGLIHS